MESVTEKRTRARVPVHFKIKVETIRGIFNGMGRDLSERGIGVYLKKLPPIGSAVELFFVLPSGQESIGITGEVMYHRRGGPGPNDDWMGIKFVRMDAECLEQLRRYIQDCHEQLKRMPIPPPLPDS